MTIKDETESRLKFKVDKLKSGQGKAKLLSDPAYPLKIRALDQAFARAYAEDIGKKVKELELLVKYLRSHIKYIGDTDKFVAGYLLIGKSFISLKAIVWLLRAGFSFQVNELVRSSMESLHLANSLLEDGQEKLLEDWFKGKIIGNSSSRGILHEAVNKMAGSQDTPMKDALSDIYNIYSSFTHSAYPAIFEYIDVFNEDFDFDQYAQFHFNRLSTESVDNLYVNILLALKNFYIRVSDEENLEKVEKLLAKEGGSFATPDEIAKEFQRYKK